MFDPHRSVYKMWNRYSNDVRCSLQYKIVYITVYTIYILPYCMYVSSLEDFYYIRPCVYVIFKIRLLVLSHNHGSRVAVVVRLVQYAIEIFWHNSAAVSNYVAYMQIIENLSSCAPEKKRILDTILTDRYYRGRVYTILLLSSSSWTLSQPPWALVIRISPDRRFYKSFGCPSIRRTMIII